MKEPEDNDVLYYPFKMWWAQGQTLNWESFGKNILKTVVKLCCFVDTKQNIPKILRHAGISSETKQV